MTKANGKGAVVETVPPADDPVSTSIRTAQAAYAAAATKKLTLIEAVEAMAISESWLEEGGGELTPELEELLNDATFDLKEKVERVALMVRRLEDRADGIKRGEEARIVARRRAIETRAVSLKRYLEQGMAAAHLDKVEGLACTVALQLNQPSVQGAEVLTAEELKEMYEAGAPFVRLIPESFALDKKEVVAAVKRAEADGKDQDAVLPATLRVTRSRSLRIR